MDTTDGEWIQRTESHNGDSIKRMVNKYNGCGVDQATGPSYPPACTIAPLLTSNNNQETNRRRLCRKWLRPLTNEPCIATASLYMWPLPYT